MNFREIQDRLIGAESVMNELSEGRVGPAPLRAQQLPYVHTRSDMNGWGKKPGERDQLAKEDADAHSIYRREFWDDDPGPTPADVSRAIAEKQWVHLVDDDGERRALQAWVRAMAGGMSFNRWCKRVEKIAVMTGRRRKNRAVEKIAAAFAHGEADLHNEKPNAGVLPVAGKIGDVPATLASNVHGIETGLNSWADDEAFQPFIKVREIINERIAVQTIHAPQVDFDWARHRNEVRRQRDQARRKAA